MVLIRTLPGCNVLKIQDESMPSSFCHVYSFHQKRRSQSWRRRRSTAKAEPALGLPVEEVGGMPEWEGISTPAGLFCGPPPSMYGVTYLAPAPLNTPSWKDPDGIARCSLKHRTTPQGLPNQACRCCPICTTHYVCAYLVPATPPMSHGNSLAAPKEKRGPSLVIPCHISWHTRLAPLSITRPGQQQGLVGHPIWHVFKTGHPV